MAGIQYTNIVYSVLCIMFYTGKSENSQLSILQSNQAITTIHFYTVIRQTLPRRLVHTRTAWSTFSYSFICCSCTYCRFTVLIYMLYKHYVQSCNEYFLTCIALSGVIWLYWTYPVLKVIIIGDIQETESGTVYTAFISDHHFIVYYYGYVTHAAWINCDQQTTTSQVKAALWLTVSIGYGGLTKRWFQTSKFDGLVR